jgi:hypothetical protein
VLDVFMNVVGQLEEFMFLFGQDALGTQVVVGLVFGFIAFLADVEHVATFVALEFQQPFVIGLT